MMAARCTYTVLSCDSLRSRHVARLRHDTVEVPSGRYPAVVVRRSFQGAGSWRTRNERTLLAPQSTQWEYDRTEATDRNGRRIVGGAGG
ncbi:MAG: hypothetical protein JWN79_2348 [Gemmatimonadetes bacterium]|jgi:hypothetical protein|nr:hypothetical protein [Gemmatimonadota bacterium]